MEVDIIIWDNSYNLPLLVNLAVIIALFTSLRFFSGAIAHISASEELLKKDNSAFGLSLAGTTFAVTIMLSGTIYGDPEANMIEGALTIGLFGVLGIIFMAITRLIFDKVALPEISLRDEIVKGNMAVSVIDTANVIASALIIRMVMVWIPYTDLSSLIILIGTFCLSQIMLTMATLARIHLFTFRHAPRKVENELQSGNIAFSLSFAGRIIGTALAISAASQLVSYEDSGYQSMVVGWVIASFIMMIALKALSAISERVILFKVKFSKELLEEQNIAVGAVRAMIYISLGYLLAEL